MSTYPGAPLQLGSTGPAVVAVQKYLGITADYGPFTSGAVKAFQQARGLVVDGVVGQKTWDAMFPPVAGTAPVWASSQVPGGTVGKAFAFTYVAIGIPPLITYKLTKGTLPPGLVLAPTGLLGGVPTKDGSYTFTVTPSNGVTPDPADPEQNGRQRTMVIAPAAVVVPPSSGGSMIGPGIGYDTKADRQVRPSQKVAIMWRATTTSALKSVRWNQRGGPAYSLGNGGTTTISIQADDGSGHPNGVNLGSGTWAGGNASSHWEKNDAVTLSPQPVLTKGKVYYAVFTNPDANNCIAVNSVFVFNAVTPRQPRFSDADLGLLYTSGGPWGSIAQNYTPVVDLLYADGTHDGQSYYEAMIDKWVTISASNKARQKLVGHGKAVSKAGVRVRRGTGSSPLVMSLVDASGTVLDTASVPASSIPVSSPGGDNGGSVWAVGSFAAARTLTAGAIYYLVVSAASGTTYTTHPIRSGGATGSIQSYADPGEGQKTTNGSSWEAMYPYGTADMQCYAV